MLDLDKGNKHGGARDDAHHAKVAADLKGCLLKTRRHAGLDYTGGKVTRSVVIQGGVFALSAVFDTSYFTCFIVAPQFGCSNPGASQANTHCPVDLPNNKLKLSIY